MVRKTLRTTFNPLCYYLLITVRLYGNSEGELPKMSPGFRRDSSEPRTLGDEKEAILRR